MVFLLTSSSARADALAARIGGGVLLAPHLLPTEVDSVLRGLELGGKLSRAQASAARAAFAAFPIELWDWPAIGDRAWTHRANLTIYDAAYVALAETARGVVVTGDARLSRAPGLRCDVELYG